MANNNIEDSGSKYLPAFHRNQSGSIVATDHTRATNNPRTGNTSDSVGHYYGGCTMHWGASVVYNYLLSQGLIPSTIGSNQALIYAEDINSLKNTLNTLISGWTQTEGTKTYNGSTKTFSSTNESISASYINNNAYSDTIITENIWNDVLDRLNILDVADSINLDSSQIGSYSPGVGIVITRVDYNRLVKAIVLVAKACKCNSDCACNLVCNCNADCGCNYSDERLKENIIFLNYEHGLKIYQYNYISDPKTIYKGVLAQDLIGTKYECALSLDDNNFYKVDYKLLPVKLIKL